MLRYHLLLSIFIGFTLTCTPPLRHETQLYPSPTSLNGSIINGLLGEWELTLNYPTGKDRTTFTIVTRDGRLVGKMKHTEFIIFLENNYIKWSQEIDNPKQGKLMAYFSGQRKGLNIIKGTVLLERDGRSAQKVPWTAGRTHI